MSHNVNDIGDTKDIAKRRMEIAKDDLSEAFKAYENELYRSANNRAYYAIYHAITACLALKLLSYKTHSLTLANFNKEFIHTEIFPKDLGRKAYKAIEIRHASDYDDFYIVSKDEKEKQIENAQYIVSTIDEYIIENTNE